jgi:hypothetical protein
MPADDNPPPKPEPKPEPAPKRDHTWPEEKPQRQVPPRRGPGER